MRSNGLRTHSSQRFSLDPAWEFARLAAPDPPPPPPPLAPAAAAGPLLPPVPTTLPNGPGKMVKKER